MILPDVLPSASNINSSAGSLEKALSALEPTVTDIAATWKGLYAAYQAPEADTVYAALAPLNTVPDDLVTNLGKAATALRSYASSLSTLATRRIALLSERTELMKPEAIADLRYYDHQATYNARVDIFNSEASMADADCARALGALRTSATWGIAGALQIPNGFLGGSVQGLGAELLERYRGRILVPGPGAVIPVIPRVAELVPEITFNGLAMSRSPGGMFVPTSSLRVETPTPLETTRLPGWRDRLVFNGGNPSLGAPPPWARWGGRTLGIAGAGLTLWGTYTDSYNDTLTRHPSWSEDQRTNEAVIDTAVVGGSAIAGGAGGAYLGALAGAAIGSAFPVIGTLIGGIVGGVIGGVAAGWGAQEMSQSFVDITRGDK